MKTFEDWWATRTQYGTENKDLARDAWFAGQAAVNAALSWRHNDEARIGGAPVAPGVTIYTFDNRGRWLFYLPPLP